MSRLGDAVILILAMLFQVVILALFAAPFIVMLAFAYWLVKKA